MEILDVINNFKDKKREFIQSIENETAINLFNSYKKEIESVYSTDTEYLEALSHFEVIEKHLSVRDLRGYNHDDRLDIIRSLPLSISRKEKLLRSYINFINWSSEHTCGFVWETSDYLRDGCKDRLIPFDVFINFVENLTNAKDELVAYLLYFRYERTLECILSLRLEEIDYDKYPSFVRSMIQKVAEERNSGLLFIGRQGKPYNSGTVFRNFQSAADKAQIGVRVTPRLLHLNDYDE